MGANLSGLEACAAALVQAERLLVTMHVQPDGDAIGSALALAAALRRAGKQVTVYSADPPPACCRILAGVEEIQSEIPPDAVFDVTVACDAGERARLGPAVPPVERRGVIVNIDHHSSGQPFGDINYIDYAASATGVLIARLLRHLGWPIDVEIARCLWITLVTDTGSFCYANTNTEALQLATDLSAIGVSPSCMAALLEEHPPADRVRWLGHVLTTLALSESGRIAWLVVLEDAADTEGLIDYPRSIAGVEVAALFRNKGGQVRVSLRSNGRIDAGAFAKARGGGGHPGAGGFLSEGSIESFVLTVIDELERQLGPPVDG